MLPTKASASLSALKQRSLQEYSVNTSSTSQEAEAAKRYAAAYAIFFSDDHNESAITRGAEINRQKSNYFKSSINRNMSNSVETPIKTTPSIATKKPKTSNIPLKTTLTTTTQTPEAIGERIKFDSEKVWKYFLGTEDPFKFLNKLSPFVGRLFGLDSSPSILSPSIVNLSPESQRSAKTASLFSIYNRSDSLIRLTDFIDAEPQLLHSIKELILESVHENIQKQKHLDEESAKVLRMVDSPQEATNITWLKLVAQNLSADDARTITQFYENVWLRNETLRKEWRQWFRQSRSLDDVQLDSLMNEINSTQKNMTMNQILTGAVYRSPYILGRFF